MEPKEKRNKEVHTATVFLPAGTKVRHLQTGESVLVPEDTKVFGWYLLEKMQWFYWTVFMEDPLRGEYLAMVRRDKVAMVSGTHRVVHREVIQKRMRKILEIIMVTISCSTPDTCTRQILINLKSLHD